MFNFLWKSAVVVVVKLLSRIVNYFLAHQALKKPKVGHVLLVFYF